MAQIPPRDRLRPLLAVLIVIFETFGLANLISEEVERGTIRALLVTPMTVKDLFIAKGIIGVGLAFIQGVLFLAIVGGMNQILDLVDQIRAYDAAVADALLRLADAFEYAKMLALIQEAGGQDE